MEKEKGTRKDKVISVIDGWFGNIGKSIKLLAVTIYVLILFISFVFGIEYISKKFYTLGTYIIVGGLILAIVSTIFIYAFGQLVENSDKTIELKEEELKQDKSNFDRLIVAIENIGNNQDKKATIKNEGIKKEQKKAIIEEIKKKENSVVESLKNLEKTELNLIKEFESKNEEIKEATKEKVQRISNLKTVSNIKNQYKDWYKTVKKYSNEELINVIENDKDWQYEYVILCCIEYAERTNMIKKKEETKNKK